eukprot:1692516-Amphidinium_carterae.2
MSVVDQGSLGVPTISEKSQEEGKKKSPKSFTTISTWYAKLKTFCLSPTTLGNCDKEFNDFAEKDDYKEFSTWSYFAQGAMIYMPPTKASPTATLGAGQAKPGFWVRVAAKVFMTQAELSDASKGDSEQRSTPYGVKYVESGIVAQAQSGWIDCPKLKSSHHGAYKGFVPFWVDAPKMKGEEETFAEIAVENPTSPATAKNTVRTWLQEMKPYIQELQFALEASNEDPPKEFIGTLFQVFSASNYVTPATSVEPQDKQKSAPSSTSSDEIDQLIHNFVERATTHTDEENPRELPIRS